MKNKKQNKERELYPCPVCGETMVSEYDICDVCEWENTGPGEQIDGGPNEMTYAEAVEHWNKHHTKVK